MILPSLHQQYSMWNALFGGGGGSAPAAGGRGSGGGGSGGGGGGGAQAGIVEELSAAQQLLQRLARMPAGDAEALPALNECSRLSEPSGRAAVFWAGKGWHGRDVALCGARANDRSRRPLDIAPVQTTPSAPSPLLPTHSPPPTNKHSPAPRG